MKYLKSKFKISLVMILALILVYQSLVVAFAADKSELYSNIDSNDNSHYPIIIIPGIMGSRLFLSDSVFNDTTKVWDPVQTAAGLFRFSSNISKTLYPRPCENQNIDLNDTSNTGSVIKYGKEYGASDTYKPIVDALCSKYSYTDPSVYRPIYVFSYDWRQSNTYTADVLKSTISKILSDEKSTKADLLCHSMGGLVASAYYSKYGNNNINKIITCGTPYEGAPALFDTVMSMNISGLGSVGGNSNIASIISSISGLSDTIKSFDGAIELAPTYNYVCDYPVQKGVWTPFAIGEKSISYNDYEAVCNTIFDQQKFSQAQSFQNSILSSSGYNSLLDYDKSYFVLGTNHATLSAIKFDYSDNDQSLYETDIEYDINGDGTVPYLSASISNNVKNLPTYRWTDQDATHIDTICSDICINWITDVLDIGASNINNYSSASKDGYTVVRIVTGAGVTVTKDDETLSSVISSFNSESSFGRMDIVGKNKEVKLFCINGTRGFDVEVDSNISGHMDCEFKFYNNDGELISYRMVNDVPLASHATAKVNDVDVSKDTILQVDEKSDGITDSTLAINDIRLKGDVDFDNKVSIMDATTIQMYLAKLTKLTDYDLTVAKTDGDSTVSITDATIIQMYLAKLISTL